MRTVGKLGTFLVIALLGVFRTRGTWLDLASQGQISYGSAIMHGMAEGITLSYKQVPQSISNMGSYGLNNIGSFLIFGLLYFLLPLLITLLFVSIGADIIDGSFATAKIPLLYQFLVALGLTLGIGYGASFFADFVPRIGEVANTTAVNDTINTTINNSNITGEVVEVIY